MSEKHESRDDQTLEDSKTALQVDVDAAAADPVAASSDALPGGPSPGKGKDKPKDTPKPEQSTQAKLLGNLVFVLGFVATLVVGYFVGQWVRETFGDKPQPESGDRY